MSTLRRADEILAGYAREEAPLFILEIDPAGIVVGANPFAVALLGADPAGRSAAEAGLDFGPLAELMGPDEGGVREHRFHVGPAAGEPQTLVFRFYSLGDSVLAVGRPDVAEAEWMKRELADLNNELTTLTRKLNAQNAELMRLNELKNRFLGLAAHDLRKPAGVILAYSDFLLEEAGPTWSDEQRAFLETIRRTSESMAGMIDGFLDLAVIEAGRLTLAKTRLDPAALIRMAIEPLRLLARQHDVAVEMSAAGPIPLLDADGPKIEQVLGNLVMNAAEYSPPGGTVTVALRIESGCLRVEVADRGPGIPADIRGRLFQAFAAGGPIKRSGKKSTGLGLVISRMIVEAHGGRIGAESRPGGGTIFTFTLPVPAEAADPGEDIRRGGGPS